MVLAGGTLGWLSQVLPLSQRQSNVRSCQNGEGRGGRVGEAELEGAIGCETGAAELGSRNGQRRETDVVARRCAGAVAGYGSEMIGRGFRKTSERTAQRARSGPCGQTIGRSEVAVSRVEAPFDVIGRCRAV